MVPYKLNHLKLIRKVFQNDVCYVTHLSKHVRLWKSPINELTWFFLLQPWVDPNDFDMSLMMVKLNKTTKLAKMMECEQSNQLAQLCHNQWQFNMFFVSTINKGALGTLHQSYCVWMGKQGQGTKGFASRWYKAS